MKKLIIVLCLPVILLVAGCSSVRMDTTTQIYGTPIRLEYQDYHRAVVYFESGEPVYLDSENAIVWEDFIVLGVPYKFTVVDNRNTVWDSLIEIKRQ